MEYLKNVATLKVEPEKCTGCGMCTAVCPHDVLKIEDRKVTIINLDGCMECGACAINCPVEAIQVDSGVGCASGVIKGLILGTEPTCDCDCA